MYSIEYHMYSIEYIVQKPHIACCSHHPQFKVFVQPLEQGLPQQPFVSVFIAILGFIHPAHLGQCTSQLLATLQPLDPVLDVIKSTPSLNFPQAVQLPLGNFLTGSLTNSGQCQIHGVHVLSTWIGGKFPLILQHIKVERRKNQALLFVTKCLQVKRII